MDNPRKCPNCHADARYGGQLSKCKDCGGVFCSNCAFNGHGGMCPYCGSNEYKAF